MFDLETPTSTDDLTARLSAQGDEIEAFFACLELEELFASQGEHWSPAEHLRHLVKSVRPVVGALGVPRMVLRARFGRSKDGSRTFDEIVELYRDQLAQGATAGPFSPSRREPEGSLDDWRAHILASWRKVGEELVAALDSWEDRALDRYLLPHPLLGKMTVREILYFTLYHNAHHARRVVERRQGGAT